MSEDNSQTSHNHFQRRFPALRILEAAQIALSPASVLVAALAAMLLGGLESVVDRSLPGVQSISAMNRAFPGLSSGFALPQQEVLPNNEMLARPWTSVVGPMMVALIPATERSARANGLIRFAIGLGLWSLVGLVLSRRSALLFAGRDESPFWRAIQYTSKRWTAAAGAPLIPTAAALFAGIVIAFVAIPGWLPFVGSIWLFIASPLIATLGFAMAFLLFATAIGWPLMVSAVATDDCDSFGGLSRAYSSLTGRPWNLAGYVLVAIIVGAIFMPVVHLVADTTIWCAVTSASFGTGFERSAESLSGPVKFVARQFADGVGISFFWSAATVIYLLLRNDVDGIPLERVAPDDQDRPSRDPLPVVGIPATDAKHEPAVEPQP